MKAKVPNCQCISLQSSTGKLHNPQLMLDGAPIPFMCDPVRFLGMEVQVPSKSDGSRESLLVSLEKLMKAVDITPLTRGQKLLMYKAGVCPRLTWPLLIHEFLISWVEKHFT